MLLFLLFTLMWTQVYTFRFLWAQTTGDKQEEGQRSYDLFFLHPMIPSRCVQEHGDGSLDDSASQQRISDSRYKMRQHSAGKNGRSCAKPTWACHRASSLDLATASPASTAFNAFSLSPWARGENVTGGGVCGGDRRTYGLS